MKFKLVSHGHIAESIDHVSLKDDKGFNVFEQITDLNFDMSAGEPTKLRLSHINYNRKVTHEDYFRVENAEARGACIATVPHRVEIRDGIVVLDGNPLHLSGVSMDIQSGGTIDITLKGLMLQNLDVFIDNLEFMLSKEFDDG